MKKKLYMDELESFIAESADEVRMYPSDKVWRNINKELHDEKQWPALTFGAILTSALMLAALVFLHPDKDLFEIRPLVAQSAKPLHANRLTVGSFEAPKGKILQPAPVHHEADEIAINEFELNNGQPRLPKELSTKGSLLVEPAFETANAQLLQSVGILQINQGSSLLNVTAGSFASEEIVNTDPLFRQIAGSALGSKPVFETASNLGVELSNSYSDTNQIKPTTTSKVEVEKAASVGLAEVGTTKITLGKKSSRWGIQYYITPSTSFRILTEEKDFEKQFFANGQIPSSYYNDVTKVVHHKEGFGLEGGAAITYSVANRLKIKAGVQLNYRQYAIEAFKSPIQQASVLRLNLGDRYDSIMVVSDVINYSSQESLEVRNKYVQISVPVGFEVSMVEFKQAQFVLAATIQPTYNLNQQAWIISSDYQRYVQMPSLMRQWNLNTGVEAFFRFNSKGNLNWQVGPQIRYQLLSSSVKEYQVRENLIDYGFKIGVSKTLR